MKYFNTTIKNCRKIGIIGNKRVGKSFILNHLFDISLLPSPIYTTEKINIKIIGGKKFIFDCQGFGNPVLEEKYMIKDENKENVNININVNEEKGNGKEQEDKKENINDKINNNCTSNANESFKTPGNTFFNVDSDEEEEIKNNNNREEFERNKLLEEEFVTRFMVEYSDNLILVLSMLSRAEQELLERIMEKCVKYKKEKNLYVIHNLPYLTTKGEVNDYIKNVLKKWPGFNLEELKFEEREEEEEEKENEDVKNNDSPSYFSMKYKSLNVFHFIFINDYCEEKSYNNYTINKVKELVLNGQSEFNFTKKLKKTIYDLLKDYSKNEITEENIEMQESKSEENTMKIIYKGNDNLTLAKYIINEESKTRSELELKYSYYLDLKEGQEKLNILIEQPGVIIPKCIKPSKDKMKYHIQYMGKKCLSDEEMNQKDNLKIIGREFGEFVLDIPIDLKEYEIANIDNPKCFCENGIQKIVFELKNISNINIVINNEIKK